MIAAAGQHVANIQTKSGIYEFVFGGQKAELDDMLRFWAVLGFHPDAHGQLSARRAGQYYGHASDLTTVRLKHVGCDSFNTGYVRLQLWDTPLNDGLGKREPLVTGSRWMGMYTHDILALRDAFANDRAKKDWDLWLSPLVNAPLAHPAPKHDFYDRFVGLRETLVFGNRFRIAFIQRGGFDRPGFGTFDDSLPFKNTEGSHANIVQPANSFDTEFYKSVFDFETAPFGDAHDSGDEPPTIAALNLRKGEMFRVERTRAVVCPTGLLQVYSSYMEGDDLRDMSRPGSCNLCAYSVQVGDIDELVRRLDDHAAASHRGLFDNEFGQRAVTFVAPDGYTWIAVEHVG